jgi:hypothetical protein
MRITEPFLVKISSGLPAGKSTILISCKTAELTQPSVCKFNAEQAHILIHWKWHLNDWVVSRLEEEGLCTPKKLAERDKMKSKQRYKYANNIVDRWEAEGIIKTLYKDFKSQKDTARELQTRARGGWK